MRTDHAYKLTLVTLVVAMFVAAINGCAAWSTYPAIETTNALDNPKFEPIPTLMARSILYVDRTYGGVNDHLTPGVTGVADGAVDQLVFNLPPGTSWEVYDKVIEHTGGGQPMMHEDQDAYHVQQVRVRMSEAEVDVVYPRKDGLMQLVTVKFEKPLFGRYDVASARQWRIPQEPIPPHYVAPPVERVEEAFAEAPTDMSTSETTSYDFDSYDSYDLYEQRETADAQGAMDIDG